jgi:hypothetical protein
VSTPPASNRYIAGYLGIEWAVSLIHERSGQVSAWLASSEGPSYIPPDVRVPEDVRMAVADPVVGHELWDMSVAAGGADPLEVLVRHAAIRDATAPGERVLALASSLPMERVSDWAATVRAAGQGRVHQRSIPKNHRCG